jgi:hypothetical protein
MGAYAMKIPNPSAIPERICNAKSTLKHCEELGEITMGLGCGVE